MEAEITWEYLIFSKLSQIKAENQKLQSDNAEVQEKMNALGVNEYYETKAKIEQMQKESSAALQIRLL